MLAAGGFANAASQDTFCSGTKCVFWRIYDQSPQGNHLAVGPPGGAHNQQDIPADATAGPLTVGGHRVYGLRMDPPSGYRNDTTSGIAVGDEAETMYAVFNGTHYNNRCCFDYGNAETDNHDDGAGTMVGFFHALLSRCNAHFDTVVLQEAVYFGNAKGGLNHGGAGAGPWIMADMENALWGADVVESNEEPINHAFVTAMVKGDVSLPGPPGPYQQGVDFGGSDMKPCGALGCVLSATASYLDCEAKCNSTAGCVGYVFADKSCSHASGPICWTKAQMGGSGTKAQCRNSRKLQTGKGHWAIKGADAQSGPLKVYWDGARAPNYAPMKKQGAIILGIGGDNSDGAVGTFYEGVMTKGYSSNTTDDAVQANIVAAGYGK